MRNYRTDRPGRSGTGRPETYRTKTERNVVQQRDLIMSMDSLNIGEHITIQQVASKLDCKKSICSVRLIELVNQGKLEKIARRHTLTVDGKSVEMLDHRWKKRRTIVNPLSILWVKGAYNAA
jgi:hypothetical protein